MKTMKYLLAAVCACFLAACSVDTPDNAVTPEPDQDVPTAKEKTMIPTEMIWRLDSILVINYPGTAIETQRMLYAGQDTYQWTYTFYPCTYQFPDDLMLNNDFEGGSIRLSEQFDKDFCKYLCTVDHEIISAGYLCYYKDKFTFSGLQQGCWVEFMIRETDTKWDSVVWTSAYNSAEAQDGTVEERVIEYYSRLRE